MLSAGTVGRAASTARSAGRMGMEKGDIKRAKEDRASRPQDLSDVEKKFEQQVAELQESANAASFTITTKNIRPRKTDMDVSRLGLAWTPWIVRSGGKTEPGFGGMANEES
jgi:hypothetical protein